MNKAKKLTNGVIRLYRLLNEPSDGMMSCEDYDAPDGTRIQWGLIKDGRFERYVTSVFHAVIFAPDRKGEPQMIDLSDDELPGFFKVRFPDYDWRQDLYDSAMREVRWMVGLKD